VMGCLGAFGCGIIQIMYSFTPDKIASVLFVTDRDDQSSSSTIRPLVRSASTRARRSASPMQRVQITGYGSRRSNASVIRSINCLPDRSRTNRDSSSNSEYESAGNNEASRERWHLS